MKNYKEDFVSKFGVDVWEADVCLWESRGRKINEKTGLLEKMQKGGGIEKSGKNQKTKDNIAESLFEVVNGLHGIRDEIHTKWEKEAKRYLKRITKEKNICLSHNTIEIQSSDGQRTIHKITIS